MIQIDVDVSELLEFADHPKRIDLKPAISAALNRAGDQVMTAVGRQLAEQASAFVMSATEAAMLEAQARLSQLTRIPCRRANRRFGVTGLRFRRFPDRRGSLALSGNSPPRTSWAVPAITTTRAPGSRPTPPRRPSPSRWTDHPGPPDGARAATGAWGPLPRSWGNCPRGSPGHRLPLVAADAPSARGGAAHRTSIVAASTTAESRVGSTPRIANACAPSGVANVKVASLAVPGEPSAAARGASCFPLKFP
jgi:hypothetical protein